MIGHLSAVALVTASILAPDGLVRAQQPAQPFVPPVQPGPIREGALLKVQVVISRYQGEKKISSQPYTMTVTANGPRATSGWHCRCRCRRFTLTAKSAT